MDWEKWLNEYTRVGAMDFEEWLLDRFNRKYGRQCKVRLDKQDLLHVDLWKNGHRNFRHILHNEENMIPGLTLPDNNCLEQGDCVSCELIVDRIKSLDKLSGVGVPTASAILTVLRPNVFSVIDKFAIKAMKKLRDDANQLPYSPRAQHYATYMKAFWDLAANVTAVSGWSFRDIDRALWAYGKDLFEHDE